MVAKALGVTSAEAEAFMTSLSRDPDSGVSLEVDADGKLFYLFKDIAPDPWPPLGEGLRVSPATSPSPGAERVGVRVAPTDPVLDEPDQELGAGETKRARRANSS
jgi:hypothetical protein